MKRNIIKDSKHSIIRGNILNHLDSIPLRDVMILSEVSAFGELITDNNGYFEIKVKPQKQTLVFFGDNSDLTFDLEIKKNEVLDITVYLGIGDQYTSFTTNKPKRLKKNIKKQNKKREKVFWN